MKGLDAELDIQGDRTSSGKDHQQEVLRELPGLQDSRYWSVCEASQQLRAAMEMRGLYREDDIEREVRWFEEFEYGRAVLQVHVEQVLGKRVKERKEIYKRWRADLGDEQARRYAKFAEYVQENGRPKWFRENLTRFPDMTLLKPSSVSTELPVSLSTSPPTPTATRSWSR